MNTNHFTLHEVVAGVWEAEADFTKASVGNAAIIDVGGKTIIVDTFMTAVAAAELREAAEGLTGNQVHLAVNSHWHSDHVNGNQVFADVPIISTRQTADRIRDSFAGFAQWEAELEAATAAREAAAAAGDTGAVGQLEQHRHFLAHAAGFRLTLPDVLIGDKLVVAGERSVEILTYGRGHTVSDIVAWLPDERVIVTGDLCWNGIHPRTQDGFPADWATYVETLLALDPVHVVPGHGRPAGPEALVDLPDYFRSVASHVSAVRAGADPQELEPPSSASDWAGIDRFRTGITLLARG